MWLKLFILNLALSSSIVLQYPPPFVEVASANPGSTLRPLFAEPRVPQLNFLTDFIGRDQDVVQVMSFDASQVETRMTQLRAMEQDFQSMQGKSREAMQLGVRVLSLHHQHALYLENIRGLGLTDKRYPDIDHFIKVARRHVISYSQKLLKAYPQSPYGRKWRISEIISRMRIGDDSVFKTAVAFAKKTSGSAEANRIKALGAALTASGKTRQNYGSLDSALELNIDAHSMSSLKLLAAESLVKKNKARSMRLFQQAAREGLGIKRPGGDSGPITKRASARILHLAVSSKPRRPDSGVVDFFQGIGMREHVQFYIEQAALNNIPRSPETAIGVYDSLFNINGTSREARSRVALRTLDIAISARKLPLIEDRWKRLSRESNKMKTQEVFSRVLKTQNLSWSTVTKKPTPANVEQFVRLHDSFSRSIPLYASDDKWKLRSLEALSTVNQHGQVSKRADVVAREAKTPKTKLAALRFSARAKEKLIGITQVPKFSKNPSLNGGRKLSLDYIAVNQAIIPLVSGTEKERAMFQVAYMTMQVKGRKEGNQSFMTTLKSNPRSPLAPSAAAYLLDDALSQNDYVFTERLARSLKKWSIRPSTKRFANLNAILEFAVFEQAKFLAQQNKNAEAANKFVAFQKEFPKSKKADMALHLASRNYTAARQVDSSIKQMERLLEFYPKSPLAKETLWAAAEQSKSIGQLLRSARHYSSFGNRYRTEGIDRSAWYRAAELHKSLGRFSDSIASYEKHMNAVTNKTEKVRVAKEIASMQHKYGSAQEGLASYDRVIKLASDRSTEVWARYHMVEIFLRQSMDIEARAASKKLLSISVTDKESLTLQARTRFNMGRLEASKIAEVDPMRESNLYAAVQSLIKVYNETKKNLIAPCEVPGLEWCSVGYYEAAKLSESTAEKLLTVRPPPTLDPAVVNKVTLLVKQESDRLIAESNAYASQAETALSQGAPDAEVAERIRSYAQRSRGQDAVDLQ